MASVVVETSVPIPIATACVCSRLSIDLAFGEMPDTAPAYSVDESPRCA